MARPLPILTISSSGRTFQTEEAEPFFWCGDTAWELFHRLTRAEITHYLQMRASQGFNVIQATLLAEEDGLTVPNPEGLTPLDGLKPETPNLDYFKFAREVMHEANELGLYFALLPSWGDKVNLVWGKGPEVFNERNAFSYGKFVADFFSECSNIVWVIGGDRATDDKATVFDAMAKGIRAGEKRRHLMTYHPPGGKTSSEFFGDKDWLDFSMLQTGHWWYGMRADLQIMSESAKKPSRPVIDGEPCYENSITFKGIMEIKDRHLPPLDDKDVRKAIYWGSLAGGAGFTYGCHAIWQFAGPGFPPVNHPIGTWQQSLDLPGARQAIIHKRLMEEFEFWDMKPSKDLLITGSGADIETAGACVNVTGSKGLIYLPSPREITIDRSVVPMARHYSWFNPRSGERAHPTPLEDQLNLSPPTAEDWVLLLLP